MSSDFSFRKVLFNRLESEVELGRCELEVSSLGDVCPFRMPKQTKPLLYMYRKAIAKLKLMIAWPQLGHFFLTK
jgi:hypothetical protein